MCVPSIERSQMHVMLDWKIDNNNDETDSMATQPHGSMSMNRLQLNKIQRKIIRRIVFGISMCRDLYRFACVCVCVRVSDAWSAVPE